MTIKSSTKSGKGTKRAPRRQPLNNVVPIHAGVVVMPARKQVNMEIVALIDELLTRAKAGDISDFAGVLVRPNGRTRYFSVCTRHKWALVGVLSCFTNKLQRDLWGE